MVLQIDADSVIRWASPSVESVLGWSPRRITGTTVTDLDHPADRVRAQEWRAGFRVDFPAPAIELRVLTGDGSYRWTSIHARPTAAADGSIDGRVVGLRDIHEEVLARQELAVQRERLELVLAGTRQGLWDWNMLTGELVVDEQWARILGYQVEEMSPVSDHLWQLLCHPQDLARSDGLVAELGKDRSSDYDLEVRMKHRDGRWVWVRDRGKIVEWTADGRPARMTGTHEDITELVTARELVQAERVRLRATMDSLMDPHVLLEAIRDEAGVIVDFVYTDANPAACAYTGLDYQNLVGARLLDLLPGQRSAGLLESYRQVVDTGEPLALDDVAYDQEVLGTQQRFYDLRATRVGDGLSLTWRDITDRQTAALALAEAQTRYRLLAENATDVVWQVDADTTVRWVTPSVESVLRWRPEQVLGVPTTELVYPQDRAALATWRAAVFAGAAPSPVEIRLLTGDGDYRWMSMQTRPMASPDGSVRGAIVGLRDVHHEVLARQALQVSEQRYKMLAENASDVVAQLD
ncbi:MAG: PAS domain S-box protein, partial [Actinomycetes bacterium]